MDPIIQLMQLDAQDKEMNLRREMDRQSRDIDALPKNIGMAAGCASEEQDAHGKIRISWNNPLTRRPTHEVC